MWYLYKNPDCVCTNIPIIKLFTFMKFHKNIIKCSFDQDKGIAVLSVRRTFDCTFIGALWYL